MASRTAGSTIERVRVWSADGVILYSDDPRQVGLRYPLGPEAIRAMTGQGIASNFADLDRADNVYDRGLGESLYVYAGARASSGRPILVEMYFALGPLDADQVALTRIATVVPVSLLALGLLLVPLGYSPGRRMSRVDEPDGPATA